MAKVLSYGTTDTSGVPKTPSLALVPLNYKADFRTNVEKPSEVVIGNLTSPLGQPEKFRFAYDEVKNIYANTGIEPTQMDPSKRGVSLLCQLNDTWAITDTEDTTFRVLLPVSAHLVLKVPCNDMITTEHMLALIGRCVSGLFDGSESEPSKRLAGLVRGSLEPSGL